MKTKNLLQMSLIAMSLVLIGCGQSNQPPRQTVQMQPNPGVGLPGGGQPINPGTIAPGGEFQVQGGNLQQAIEALVSVNAEPTPVGPIGQTQGSGVFISAMVNLNAPIQQAMSGAAQVVAQGSSFSLRARDSYSGQPDPRTGQAIPDISVRITPDVPGFRVQGQIQGGRFSIVYADNYGQIMLDGAIQGQSAQGQVGFLNMGMQQPMAIGQFSVPVCALFRCQ